VRICSRPPFSKGDPTQLGFFAKLRLTILRGHYDWQLDSEIVVFMQYLRHYFSGPILKPAGPDGHQTSGTLKVHPALYSVCGLLNLGFSVEQAWSEAPGMARWYIVGAAEAAGHEVNIMPTQWIEDALASGYSFEDCGFGPDVTPEDVGIFRREVA
jgi:hypothetical protein